MDEEEMRQEDPEIRRLEFVRKLRASWRYVQENYGKVVRFFGFVDFVPRKLHQVSERLQEVIEAVRGKKVTHSEIGVQPEELARVERAMRWHQRLAWLYKRIFLLTTRYSLNFHDWR